MQELGERKVYVGNLAYATTQESLLNHFSTIGTVLEAVVFTSRTGLSRGCGTVEFEDSESATKAIEELTDSVLDGRKIFVREDKKERDPVGFEAGNQHSFGRRKPRAFPPRQQAASNGERENKAQLFVGNLPWSTSWQDLKDHFSQIGPVARADVFKEGGRSKGQGIVRYEKAEDAERAIREYNDTDFQGRKLIVHKDRFAMKQ